MKSLLKGSGVELPLSSPAKRNGAEDFGGGIRKVPCYNWQMPKHPPTKKMIRDLLHFEVSPDEIAYKRITQKLRELILAKSLLPGTRLPTLTELAALWDTNYFTVQTALTPLVNEGLLVRRQRTGTFVAESTRQIKAVGVYYGSSFWWVKHAAFYQILYAALCDYFEKLGIDVHLFMDSRPGNQRGTPWKLLLDAIERSKVNAVIGAMLTRNEASWLEKLPVPVGFFGMSDSTRSALDLGMEDSLRSSLVRLKERKCRSVALITAISLPEGDWFLKQAEKIGLKSHPEWVLKPETWPEDFEEFGFKAFEKIWSGSKKPEGLIINPDNIALGTIMAILKSGVRVPEELKLVLYCNEEIYFHCPMPADWLVLSITRVVEGLWKYLQMQAEGKKPRKIPVPLSLHPPSVQSPPIYREWKSWTSQNSRGSI